jgi:hypothetical protein
MDDNFVGMSRRELLTIAASMAMFVPLSLREVLAQTALRRTPGDILGTFYPAGKEPFSRREPGAGLHGESRPHNPIAPDARYTFNETNLPVTNDIVASRLRRKASGLGTGCSAPRSTSRGGEGTSVIRKSREERRVVIRGDQRVGAPR